MNKKYETNLFEQWKELFVGWNYLLKMAFLSWEYIFGISKLQKNTAENYKKLFTIYKNV